MGGVAMLLRRWRADRGLLAVLVVVVALAAGLVGAVPRLLDRLALSSLDAALDEAPPDRIGLAASTIRPFAVGDPGRAMGRLDDVAAELDGTLAPELARTLGPPVGVVDSVRYDLLPLSGEGEDPLDRKLTIRLQDGIEDHLTVVAGSLPDGTVRTIAVDLGDTGSDGEPLLTEVIVRQYAATAATAGAMGVAPGDLRLGLPDDTGPVLSRVALADVTPAVFELVGLVELSPMEDAVWFGDPRLHRPARFDTNQGATLFGTGIVTAAGVGSFPGSGSQPAAVGVRWQLDRDALLDADVEAVREAAVALRTVAPLELQEPRWATGLDRVLGVEAARRATAVEALGLGAVAVLGVAAALLVAVAALLAGRRRETLALVRSRGASSRQLLTSAVLEFGLVVLLAGVVALATLALVLPAAGGELLVVGVALLALVVLVGRSVSDVRRPLGALLAERRRSQPPRPVHYVLDGLLVLVAGVAVANLRRRGIDVDGTIEPLVVAAPVLTAAAAAVVAARLARLPLRAAEATTRRLRSLALPVGLARAARAQQGAVVVVLLVLGIGVAGLAASVHRSLVAGQELAAAERVGADVRIDAPALASLAPVWSPPGPGDEVAEVSLLPRASVVSDLGAQRVDVLLVDPDELTAVVDDPVLPALAWDGVGPVPVLASSELRLVGSPDAGDTVSIVLEGLERIAGHIVGFEPRVLGRDADADGTFVVIDRAAAVAATGVDAGVTSRLVDTTDPRAVEASARAADADAEVLVRERVVRQLRTAPLASGVRVGYLVAALAAIVATAVAVVMALTAAAPVRRRQAAVLAALGADRRTIHAALLAEVLPVVAGAAAAGIALAGGVALLLDGRLDLSPFTGTVDASSLQLPHWAVAVALVAGAVVLAAVGAVATLGRVDPGALLREGDG